MKKKGWKGKVKEKRFLIETEKQNYLNVRTTLIWNCIIFYKMEIFIYNKKKIKFI